MSKQLPVASGSAWNSATPLKCSPRTAARSLAVLVNPRNPSHLIGKAAWQQFADDVGLPILPISVGTESEFETAVASLADKKVGAISVAADSFFGSYRESLISALTRHAMPAMFFDRESVMAGGLISYGGNASDAQRQAGIYVGRIIRGEKPSDLPVLQPTKFDLVITSPPIIR